MTLVLNSDEIEELLTPQLCLDALEQVFSDFAAGQAANMLGREVVLARTPTSVPGARDGHVYHGLEVQSATAPTISTASLRVKSDILYWPEVNGTIRRKKFPGAPGGLYCGFVILFDTSTGAPTALMPDGLIQRMRVGATSALGTKYMSQEDSRVAGIIGAGFQAEAQIMTLTQVRSLDEIRVYSPTAASRQSLAERLRGKVGPKIIPVDSPQAALDGAQIVHAATNSRSPVIEADWVQPGTHISVISVEELGEDVLRKADILGTSRRVSTKASNTAFADGYAEDVHEDEFVHGWWHNESYWQRMVELGGLIGGRVVGRRSEQEITVYINKGAALQFSAVGARLAEKATEAGIGREIPTDWFLQPYTP